MKLNRLFLISAAAIISASCVSYQPVRLPLPPELAYPSIPPASLACLDDETYAALVERDVMCRGRIETLRGIIESSQ